MAENTTDNKMHWKMQKYSKRRYYYDGKYFYSNCNCSVCGHYGQSDFNFCPGCGRENDGKTERFSDGNNAK